MELLEFNRKGIFPSSEETEKEFFARAEKIDNLRGEIPEVHWEWVRLHLKELFDFEPTWLPTFYSNRGLAPWQGGASWFEGERLVAVQLRKGSCFGLCQKEEVLAHEAVHAARGPLRSRKWEEFFAYMTSEKRWRRVLGPIVRSPWEVWPFVGFVGLGVFWEVGYFLAAMWTALGMVRLVRGHWILRRASEKMMEKVGDRKKVCAVLVRLTDAEIEALAQGEEIGGDCLRWKAIRLAYFK